MSQLANEFMSEFGNDTHSLLYIRTQHFYFETPWGDLGDFDRGRTQNSNLTENLSDIFWWTP